MMMGREKNLAPKSKTELGSKVGREDLEPVDVGCDESVMKHGAIPSEAR